MDDFDLVFNDTVISDPANHSFSTNSHDLKNFSLLSINVNSFNMSTMNANHKNTNWFIPKLNHVLSNKCSMYLLQDVCLSDNTKSAEKFKNELQILLDRPHSKRRVELSWHNLRRNCPVRRGLY